MILDYKIQGRSILTVHYPEKFTEKKTYPQTEQTSVLNNFFCRQKMDKVNDNGIETAE